MLLQMPWPWLQRKWHLAAAILHWIPATFCIEIAVRMGLVLLAQWERERETFTPFNASISSQACAKYLFLIFWGSLSQPIQKHWKQAERVFKQFTGMQIHSQNACSGWNREVSPIKASKSDKGKAIDHTHKEQEQKKKKKAWHVTVLRTQRRGQEI